MSIKLRANPVQASPFQPRHTVLLGISPRQSVDMDGIVSLAYAKNSEINPSGQGPGARKLKKRFHDLKRIVELDINAYEFFNIAPLTEYDRYIRSFGSDHTNQVACQSGDDLVDRESQTEDWSVEDVWIQATPNAVVETGSGVPFFETMQFNVEGRNFPLLSSQRSQKLSRFLKSSSMVNFFSLLSEKTPRLPSEPSNLISRASLFFWFGFNS